MARIICAIGDVHGERDMLRRLHEKVFEQHETRWPGSELLLVHLGDYVDRGPDSCGVIEDIMALKASARCDTVNLRGNHEQMMLDAMKQMMAPDTGEETLGASALEHWALNGGEETLTSYEKAGHGSVPAAHIAWLDALPFRLVLDEEKLILVHAGIDPKRYPDEPEDVLIWTRSPRFYDPGRWKNQALDGWRVVHGHTPTKDNQPQIAGESRARINIDTGAVYGGALTGAFFAPGEAPSFVRIEA